jgi:neutral amino acid transport system substrate-binding protein
MKSRRMVGIPALGCALVGASFLVGNSLSCSSSSQSQAPPGDAGAGGDGAAGTIVIGVTLPLTGDLASLGKGQSQATQVAEAQLNANGGVLGQQISFRVVDDATDVKVATTNANQFIADGLPAVLGPSQSAQANAVVPLLYAAKVVEISSSVTSDSFTKQQPARDRFFFRTVPPFAVQAKVLGSLARNGPPLVAVAGLDAGASDGGAPSAGCTNMALVHYDDSFGNPFRDAYQDNFKALGGSIVVDVPVAQDPRQSYADAVAMIIAARPPVECVGLIATPQIGATFMRDYKAGIAADTSRDWSNVIVAAHNGLNKSDFITLGRVNPADPNSPTSAEGVYGTNVDSNPSTAEFNDFKNLFTARFPLPAGTTSLPGNAANQYDAAILIALAIQQAGTATDTVKIRDALFAVTGKGNTAYGPGKLREAFASIANGQPIDYVGASGNLNFDDFGNVVEDFIIWKVENGKFKVVAKVPASSIK